MLTVALMAFLTVVDLFAAQAVLPMLRDAYGVSPASVSAAVNASTLGMAVGGFAMALVSHRIERRAGIMASLLLLAVPTAALGLLPALPVFTLLRVAQGLCMAAAFTLTLAWLGEQAVGGGGAGLFAAYITGNVASNLVGRLIAAGIADHLGLPITFLAFAGLNLAGAALAAMAVRRAPPPMAAAGRRAGSWRVHLRNPRLVADFGLGFCILFAFIGIFTFVNFVLTGPPLSLGMMQLGLVYVVFLPSIVTTPLAGQAVRRLGTRPAAWAALAVAIAGLPLLLTNRLAAVLGGLVLVAIGTFLAQAIATGFVGRAATMDRGAASGMYLASYFGGGLAGSLVLGQAFERGGWPAVVLGVGLALLAGAALVGGLRPERA
jgi:predicted MFS family arabinose efflux permease